MRELIEHDLGELPRTRVDFDDEAHRARERVHEDDVRHSGELRGHVVEASRLALELDEVGGAEGREARDADGPRFEERETATRHRPERLPEDVSNAAPRGAPLTCSAATIRRSSSSSSCSSTHAIMHA